MKYGFIAGIIAAVALISLPGTASAAQSADSIQIRLQALMAELQTLQAELARIQTQTPVYGTPGSVQCYPDIYGTKRCYQYYVPPTTYGTYGGPTSLERIDVEFEGNFARIEIEYRDGDDDEFTVAADSREEVIEFLLDETNESRAAILAVARFDEDNDRDNDEDDIDEITAYVGDDDTEVRVRLGDGDV